MRNSLASEADIINVHQYVYLEYYFTYIYVYLCRFDTNRLENGNTNRAFNRNIDLIIQ